MDKTTRLQLRVERDKSRRELAGMIIKAGRDILVTALQTPGIAMVAGVVATEALHRNKVLDDAQTGIIQGVLVSTEALRAAADSAKGLLRDVT